MAGIPTSSSSVEPLAAVRALAEAGAKQRDASLIGADLRLFRGSAPIDAEAATGVDTHQAVSPFQLGRTYELLLHPTDRRKSGAHLTPEGVARQLVGLQPEALATDRVLDPAVGGAAFLLAAADQLVEAGAQPASVLDQLFGVDIDPGAVAVAEAALALWSLDHGIGPRALPQIAVGDGLLSSLPSVERVVGNPPFLNQLRSSSTHTKERRQALRDRWGDLVGAYTDDAWLFVAAGLDALNPGGTLALVQPVSILAARHAHAVREWVHEHAELTALWVARDHVFDAAVHVCGIVASRQPTPRPESVVERRVGADFDPVAALASQPTPSEWGSAAGTAVGIPAVHLVASQRTVGDLATATAGFRDQFYGFVPFVAEEEQPSNEANKFITVGMIDPLGLSWGDRSFKFAKRPFVRPVVDIDALELADPRLGEWVEARRRPKILMATQTRVVEVWVDEAGDAVPATPVLSIEPANTADLWPLAAALSAPAISAWVLGANFGTAMSLNAMKLAAADVLALPLPAHEEPWMQAASMIQASGFDPARFATLMGQAYGATEASLASWWLDRADMEI